MGQSGSSLRPAQSKSVPPRPVASWVYLTRGVGGLDRQVRRVRPVRALVCPIKAHYGTGRADEDLAAQCDRALDWRLATGGIWREYGIAAVRVVRKHGYFTRRGHFTRPGRNGATVLLVAETAAAATRTWRFRLGSPLFRSPRGGLSTNRTAAGNTE